MKLLMMVMSIIVLILCIGLLIANLIKGECISVAIWAFNSSCWTYITVATIDLYKNEK